MKPVVVDASVGIKWFITEIQRSHAVRLLDNRFERIVPDLWFCETGNILWKLVRRGELTPAEAALHYGNIQSSKVSMVPTRDIIPAAIHIAVTTGRTVYDSIYLALAVEADVPLVTADLKFYNALKDGPYRRWLVWIEEVDDGF